MNLIPTMSVPEQDVQILLSDRFIQCFITRKYWEQHTSTHDQHALRLATKTVLQAKGIMC
jgi:hypothetical protein